MMLARIAQLSGSLSPKIVGTNGFRMNCQNPAHLHPGIQGQIAGAGYQGLRQYSDECRGLIKYPKGAPCFPKERTGSEHRVPTCTAGFMHPEPKPCFDIEKVTIENALPCQGNLIRSFLYSHYWPREPTVTSLWMSLQSPYLDTLTERYSYLGDRLLAFERQDRTNERRLIGMLYADKVFPWTANDYQHWASRTCHKADRVRMMLNAHLIRAPQLFTKYHAPYLYNIEVLATLPEVQCQGVGTALMKHALKLALQIKHPVTTCAATSHYCEKICQRCNMKREWSMDYRDYIDDAGQPVFYVRRPHTKVAVYSQQYNKKLATDADKGDKACGDGFDR